MKISMNKKIFFICVLILVMTFVGFGCGSKNTDEKSDESTLQNIDSGADKTSISDGKNISEAVTAGDNVGGESHINADITAEKSKNNTESEVDAVSSTGTYEQITQDKAKELMEAEEPAVILDVRTYEEYNQGHIEGSLCIPVEALQNNGKAVIEQLIPRKDQIILVYCRSGNRSKTASQILADIGYTNVKEFGGINDWQYGTVTE